MVTILLTVFIGSVVFQLYFIFFVFNKINQYNPPEGESCALEGVSVVVCARNELENLKSLIPLLNNQVYPTFEIIIVDDRSWDGTFDYLLTECSEYHKVRFLRVKETPYPFSSKKYALTLGVKSARYNNLLLTDADCRPQSNHWIAGMAECLTPDKEIVLGFSPYFEERGFLNNLIRYETFNTAAQYFSFAIVGMPYMGVGRNLMYRKSLFLNNKGFEKHTNIVGGDDDLFMNDVANEHNTAVCLNPKTFMYSFPKTTWQAWYRQKRRHLSVSKYYKLQHKINLGGLGLSLISSWVSFIILIPVFYHKPLIYGILFFFIFRLISQMVVFSKINKRLDSTLKIITLPLWDSIFALYFLTMGINNLIPRRQKTKWR